MSPFGLYTRVRNSVHRCTHPYQQVQYNLHNRKFGAERTLLLGMRKAAGCGWEKAEKGDGDRIQWRKLGEKGKTNWPGFVLVAMVQFPIRLALTYGAEIGVEGWENNERETDCRISRT